MSKLYFEFSVSIIDEKLNEIKKNIPYAKEIINIVTTTFNKCGDFSNYFDDELKGKVAKCSISVKEDKQGFIKAKICTEFITGFRLSEKRRMACWDFWESQMSDGFGECLSYQKLMSNHKYRIYI